MKQHHNQSGALLIEVLAVLGLIGMMAPFLYKQALERNREVSNIAIAGEMRTVTEALRTAIEMDFMSQLPNNCDGLSNADTDTTVLCYSSADNNNPDLTTHFYLPDDTVLDSYTIQVFCRNTMCSCSGGGACGQDDACPQGENAIYSDPVCFGVVMSKEDNLPQSLTLRRARRIASLIGSSGGVCTAANQIDGTMGGWSLNNATAPNLDCSVDNNLGLAATTGVITTAVGTGEIAGTANVENTVDIPENVGLKDLHAWNYFSVGNGQETNCFAQNRNAGVTPNPGDTIYRVGGNSSNCDPLFWVGTPGPNSADGENAADNSDAGNVYVKNDLIVGRDNSGGANNEGTQAVRLGNNNARDAGVITVYNTAGTEVIKLEGGRPAGNNASATVLTLRDDVDAGDNQNRIIMTTSTGQDSLPKIDLIEQTNAGNTNVGMRLTSQGLEGLGADSDFKVDPRFTSRMTDIEIGARGNARLSQILPNYILKNVVSITGSGSIDVPTSTDTPSANELTCPTGYNRVLVVIPTGGTSVELATDNNQNLLSITQSQNVPISVNPGTGQGTLAIPELTPKANALVNKYPAVQIANASSHHQKVVATENADQWTVTLGYCTDKNCNSFTADNTNTMTAIAHVYCVYTGNGSVNAPTDIPADAQLTRNAE